MTVMVDVMGLVGSPVSACLAHSTSESARDGARLRQCRSRSDGQVVLPPARTCRRDVLDVVIGQVRSLSDVQRDAVLVAEWI
jgi:hypothetical protein